MNMFRRLSSLLPSSLLLVLVACGGTDAPSAEEQPTALAAQVQPAPPLWPKECADLHATMEQKCANGPSSPGCEAACQAFIDAGCVRGKKAWSQSYFVMCPQALPKPATPAAADEVWQSIKNAQ